MKCERCRVENREDARFCMSCGAPLAPEPAGIPPPPPIVPPPPPRRRHEQDRFGIIGLAFFLLAVAVTFAANPNLLADLRLWISNWTTGSPFARPPQGVITSAALFFGVEGVLMFVLTWIRGAFRDRRTRVLGAGLQGIGNLVFAYLLTLYADRAATGGAVVAVLAAVIGTLLAVWIGLGIYWNAWPWMTQEAASVPRP